MPFRFSLQPVLRLRGSFERLERLRLLAIAALIVRVRAEIDLLQSEDRAARRAMQKMLGSGAAAVEMHVEIVCEKLRARRRMELLDRLAALEKGRARQGQAYRVARRKREILENLRERRKAQYQMEESRRLQRSLDELFLLRRYALPEAPEASEAPEE